MALDGRAAGRAHGFPPVSEPGACATDVIGGGPGTRAPVRKGRPRPGVTTGTAGRVGTGLGGVGKPVPGAVVWAANAEHPCDAAGPPGPARPPAGGPG